MIRTDEDALICDLAETYNIYNYRSLPAKTVATFSVGLGENSRIKKKINGVDVDMEVLLLAAIADRLSILIWQRTEDGLKGKNLPTMIYDSLVKPIEQEKSMSFDSGDDFRTYWERKIKENANGRN